MGVSRCPKGHFYNDSKFSSCPHCASGAASTDSRSLELEISRAGGHIGFAGAPANAASEVSKQHLKLAPQKIYTPVEDDDDATVAACGEKAVGWLVCVAGLLCGKDLTLYSGKNDLSGLIGLDGVDKEAAVVYDPNNNKFFFNPGSTKAGVNSEPVSHIAALSERDRIQLSGMEFVFVPFCGEGFRW